VQPQRFVEIAVRALDLAGERSRGSVQVVQLRVNSVPGVVAHAQERIFLGPGLDSLSSCSGLFSTHWGAGGRSASSGKCFFKSTDSNSSLPEAW